MANTFLLDTNILIPLEPASTADLEPTSKAVTGLVQVISKAGDAIRTHPFQLIDIDQDKNDSRRTLRRMLFGKYVALESPPSLTENITTELGTPSPNSNNWVDFHLLAALERDAVGYLVTEDEKLHKRARRIGLSDRVLTIADASLMVEARLASSPPPLLIVKHDKAYNLNRNDPIFASIKEDYPEFDIWFTKCCNDGRDVYFIEGKSREYAAICILKTEDSPLPCLSGKVLKLCTFKVSKDYYGSKYGELLLKNLFQYAEKNSFNHIYVEVKEGQEFLIGFLEDFGFKDLNENKTSDEMRMGKPTSLVAPDPIQLAADSGVDGFEYHQRYGPNYCVPLKDRFYIVPIKPKYEEMLFPERQKQRSMFQGNDAFGNSIRKAYLCHSRIRKLSKSDLLLFYRSDDSKAVTALGIVEKTLVSGVSDEIEKFVGKITVYSKADIAWLCEKEVLAIIFRQVTVLRSPISKDELLANGLLNGAPQAIMSCQVHPPAAVLTKLNIKSL